MTRLCSPKLTPFSLNEQNGEFCEQSRLLESETSQFCGYSSEGRKEPFSAGWIAAYLVLP